MRKTLLAVALVAAFAGSTAVQAADAPASPHTFTGNLTVASEYLYRGIAQTDGAPALQGGFDYSHSSGVYLGFWGSNVSWVSDTGLGSASLEMDVYGGYKMAFGDFGLDVGVLTYNYPGSGKADGASRPDTTEVYVGGSWKFLSAKYSHTTGSLFGWTKTGQPTEKTEGSGYLELNASYDLGNGYTLVGHVGDQKVKGRETADYTDFKVGATKDLGVGVVGLAYSDTDAKGSCDAVEDYCFAGRDAGQDRVVLTFSKAF